MVTGPCTEKTYRATEKRIREYLNKPEKKIEGCYSVKVRRNVGRMVACFKSSDSENPNYAGGEYYAQVIGFAKKMPSKTRLGAIVLAKRAPEWCAQVEKDAQRVKDAKAEKAKSDDTDNTSDEEE